MVRNVLLLGSRLTAYLAGKLESEMKQLMEDIEDSHHPQQFSRKFMSASTTDLIL